MAASNDRPRPPRPGDRLLLSSPSPETPGRVWARVETAVIDNETAVDGIPPGAYPNRVVYGYEIRSDGGEETRHGLIWLDERWRDPNHQVEDFDYGE